MDILFQILLALYAFGLGRVPWRYYIPLTIPLLIFAYLAALFHGAGWLLAYTAFIVYLFPLAFVIFFLDALLGAAARLVAGREAKLPSLVRDVALFAAAFAILLPILHWKVGLPRAAAYFLGGLVAKEPLRAFDPGYYFSGWLDAARAIPAFAAYLFFFLFARQALYKVGHAFKVPPGTKFDPTTKAPRPAARKPWRYVFIIACVYVVPTVIAFFFTIHVGMGDAASYNSLGLDEDGDRVLWAELTGDGFADAVVAGGTGYANPAAYAAAFDGASGEVLWFVNLPGEWCSASPLTDGARGFFAVKHGGRGGEIVALRLADGKPLWRRRLPAEAHLLTRGEGWARRGETLLAPVSAEEAWVVRLRDGRVTGKAAAPSLAGGGEPHLERGDGVYYYNAGGRRRLAFREAEYQRVLSPYYSFRLSEWPSGWDLLYAAPDLLLINSSDKYKYGLLIPGWTDALYAFDGRGDLRWEFASGDVRDLEAVLGVSGRVILLVGRDRHRHPLLAAVDRRTGALRWRWPRPVSFVEKLRGRFRTWGMRASG